MKAIKEEVRGAFSVLRVHVIGAPRNHRVLFGLGMFGGWLAMEYVMHLEVVAKACEVGIVVPACERAIVALFGE